jgi:hypothetical protein
MRYTHAALLLFGAGLLAGLVVIAFDATQFGWVASGMMALGIAALPFTMLADWRRAAKPPPKRRPTATRKRARRKPKPRPKPVASKKPP